MYRGGDAVRRRSDGLRARIGLGRALSVVLPAALLLGTTAGPAFAAKKHRHHRVKSHFSDAAMTLFGSTVPKTTAASDASSVEVAMKFRSAKPGWVTALRFYKGSPNTGTHVGSLWSATGSLLGSVTFAAETASGWQTATLSQPVAINAGTTYIASYHAPRGRYAERINGFSSSVTKAPLTATGSRYVYSSSSAFPTKSYDNTNYYVDVVFTTTAPIFSGPPPVPPLPDPVPVPIPTPIPTIPPLPLPTPTPTSTPTPTPTAPATPTPTAAGTAEPK